MGRIEEFGRLRHKSLPDSTDNQDVLVLCAKRRISRAIWFSELTIMDAVQFPEQVQLLVNDFLVWVGYGTLIGLLAKAIMPGRDPGGAVATLAMGITGVVIGCGVWSLLSSGQRVTPISPIGLFAGTAGAFTILSFYRILGGYWGLEVDQPVRRTRRRTYRRRYRAADYD